MTTIKRAELLAVATQVRPALSNQAYLPVLTHICFADGIAVAYNDVAAIAVKHKFDLNCCVPGELLIKALQGFTGDSLDLVEDDKGVLLTSGRSKLRLPTLPVRDFPFKLAPLLTDDNGIIDLSKDFVSGVRKCLMSVGNDNTHPAQMGVTLTEDSKGYAVLFSTDNNTISTYETADDIQLPNRGAPIILPTFLCEQLVSLSKTYKDLDAALMIITGGLIVAFDSDAYLFTRALVDTEPMDFPNVIHKYCDLGQLGEHLHDIPKDLDAALSRSLLVLGNGDKSALFQIGETGFVVKTETNTGESHDHIDFEFSEYTEAPMVPFYVDPALLARGAKACDKLAFMSRVVVLASDDKTFVHLISHCSR